MESHWSLVGVLHQFHEIRISELGFVAFLLVLPGLLTYFMWRDALGKRFGRGRADRLLLISCVLLTMNLLTHYILLALAFFGSAGPPSQAGPSQHAALVAIFWMASVGIISSACGIAVAAFSKRGLARKLAIWGMSAGLFYWIFVYVNDSLLLSIYRATH